MKYRHTPDRDAALQRELPSQSRQMNVLWQIISQIDENNPDLLGDDEKVFLENIKNKQAKYQKREADNAAHE